MQEFSHIPVLANETIDLLNVRDGKIYVDGTIGGAGHSFLIENRAKIKLLIGIDQDTEALDAAKKRLEKFDNVIFVHDNFKNIKKVLADNKIDKVDGILIDIGVSSHQLDSAERGFSFRADAKLDMRMDKSQTLSAYDVVNSYSEEKLANIIKDYGEEKFAKSIARHIVLERKSKPIETTKQLENLILHSVPRYKGQDGSSNVQRTFQAIRIEVNRELEVLEEFLDNAVDCLECGGRLAVISFHSLEDRIVKQKFKMMSTGCICPPDFPVCVCGHKASVKQITKHIVTASESELKNNSRSASAKLRVVEKI